MTSTTVLMLDTLTKYIRDNVPNIDGATIPNKSIYVIKTEKGEKGKYYVCVIPKGMAGNPQGYKSSYSEYSVSIYLFYFLSNNDDREVLTERFISWASSVFDEFHLSSLGGNVNVCHCDFEMYSNDFQLNDGVIWAEVLCTSNRYNVRT